MATVVIIHAAEDALPARALAEKLRGLKVQVTIELPPGEELDRAIRTAGLALTLWSPRSITQQPLIDTAVRAGKNAAVVHLTMQNAQSPAPFLSVKSINLTGWRGEDTFPAWRETATAVTKHFKLPLPAAPAPPPPSGFFQPSPTPPSGRTTGTAPPKTSKTPEAPRPRYRTQTPPPPPTATGRPPLRPTRLRRPKGSRRRGFLAWNVYSHVASIVGAISLANIVKEMIELKKIFRDLLDAWTTIVHPIAQFLFGWVRVVWEWLHIPFHLPEWYPDYFVIGIVISSAIARGALVAGGSDLFGRGRLIRDAYGLMRQDRGDASEEMDDVLDELRKFDAGAAVSIEAEMAAAQWDERFNYDEAERRQLGATNDVSRELFTLAVFGLPVWPLSFLVSVSVVADTTSIDTIDYLRTASLFLGYFCVLLMVNFAWFFSG